MSEGKAESEQAPAPVDAEVVDIGAALSDAGANGSEPTDEIEVVIGEVEPPAAAHEPGDASSPAADDGEELSAADFGGSDEEPIMVSYEDRIVDALPELARLAAAAWTRSALWGLGVGLRVGTRLARASVDPQLAAEIAQDFGSGMRSYAREFLGITDLEDRVRLLTPPGDRFSVAGGMLHRGADAERLSPERALRIQGAELLRQSADVSVDDELHPAFGRIVGELAPDEGRILRLLAYEGDQPMVDVRAANLIGVGSQLVAQNLNMVGMQAGCRHTERAPAYLTNLQRLGLVCFGDQPLEDPIAYQVLEAQPHVLEAIKAATRAKTVQRRLSLTPFGLEFCTACFPREIDEVQELTGGEPA